jgi:hypothetical protein
MYNAIRAHEAKYIDNKNAITIMRVSKEMATAINDQISYEASSANAYTAIGSWCERFQQLKNLQAVSNLWNPSSNLV